MSWDNERTLRFIKEYEMRPILWNKENKNYYNTVKKEDAWREMSVIFEEDMDVLKKKIGSLRGSRRREKNRMTKSKGTGKGRKDIYTTNWFAWENMKFLDDTEDLRPTVSNRPKDDDEEEEHATQGITENEQGDVVVVHGNGEGTQDIPGTSTEHTPTKTFISPKKVVPKRKRIEDPRIQEAFNILKNKTEVQKDESSMFGEYIVEKLRTLNPRTRAVLQHQIHNLIFQAEMVDKYPMQPNQYLVPQVPPNNSPSTYSHTYSSPSPALSQYSATSFQSPLPSPQEQESSLGNSGEFGGLPEYVASFRHSLLPL